MPDRHVELPAHPDLEYYRKQAKHLLRMYAAGDAAAQARAADALGDRAAERFLLSDAQFVLAQEHGFRTWAEFRADIQSQRATGDRPVSRLWGRGAGDYASWADGLFNELRRGDPSALQRLRAYVPRYAAATDASGAELRDARLIVAREVGFPTWRELVAGAEKAQRDDAERQEERRRLRPEAEALLAGDTARLAQLTPEQAGTLLQMLGMRELLGAKLGEGLGVPRTAVDVLIGKATSLDVLLPQAIAATGWSMCACCSAPAPTPAPGPTASRRWRPPSTPAARGWSTCSPSTASSRRRSGPMPRAAGWTWSGPASMRTAGCGPTPRYRAPTPPTSSLSHPGDRRHPIRSRSWPRRSSTPASTAGPRSCAGSSTAA